MRERRHLKSYIMLFAAIVTGGIFISAHAGPLEPPGPPEEPTMLPIDQVDPRHPIYADMLPLTIDEPGSYYLAENISTEGAGISLQADDITIDLMGFSLEGGTGPGIDGWNNERITIRNGTIRGWTGTGIKRIAEAVLSDLTVAHNGGSGIDAVGASRIKGCIVTYNNVHGIILHNGCIVEQCVVAYNVENGIWLFGDWGSFVSGCSVNFNGKNGIRIDGSNATILNNHITGNDFSHTAGKAGIWINSYYCRIEKNSIMENNIGIDLDGNANIISGNILLSNFVDYQIDPSGTLNLFLIWDQTTGGDPGPWHNISIH